LLFLEENLGSLGVRLDPAERERLERLFPPGAAKGDRYPAATAKLIDR
jgi:hypothetical protein